MIWKKAVSESRTEQVYQVRLEHLNGAERLFGGKLMEWIDELAGLVGIRHAQLDKMKNMIQCMKQVNPLNSN